MSKKTPLYDYHAKAGAHFVDFSGWEMPLHYGSQIQEHHAVRKAVGLFDVSHMGILDISGTQSTTFLRSLLANDVAKLNTAGKALYSCMLNEKGGVIDDLIVYRFGEAHYRVVLNAGTRDSDLRWIRALAAEYDLNLDERFNLSILAVQGPEALGLLKSMLEDPFVRSLTALNRFEFFVEKEVMIARTGYTGEDGVEFILPNDFVVDFWEDLLEEGVQPIGLGARDTLRLEAGFNLNGVDMTPETSPLISNLSWTVSFKDSSRNFIGRSALEQQQERGLREKLVGIKMKERGVLRNHQKLLVPGLPDGEITSGGFSPTLGHAIALARVPIETGTEAVVERRGRRVPVEVTRPRFI